MRIDSIHIRHFAGLSDRKLSFSPDFTLIRGGNETGKTTAMNFIRMMLYGSDSSLRKNCMPLSGEPMSGSMTFTAEGQTYRLDRSFGKTRKSDRISITALATGEILSAAKDPGELFLHMNEDSFVRSCFIGTAGSISGEKGSEELRRKLQNLVSSGRESVSVSTAEKRLETAAAGLQSKRGVSGKIPEKKEELASLQKLLQKTTEFEEAEKNTDARRLAIQKEADSLRISLAELRMQKRNREKAERQPLFSREKELFDRLAPHGKLPERSFFTECRERYNRCLSAEAASLSPEILSCQARLSSLNALLPLLSGQLDAARQNASKRAAERNACLLRQRFPLPAVLCTLGLLLIPVILGCFLSKMPLTALIPGIAAPVFLIIGSVLQKKWNAEKNRMEKLLADAQKEVNCATVSLAENKRQRADCEDQILILQSQRKDTGLREREEIFSLLAPYGLKDFSKAGSLCDELTSCYDQWQKLNLALTQPLSDKPDETEAELSGQIHALELEEASCEGRLQIWDREERKSVAQLEEEIRLRTAELAELSDRYEALTTALAILQESFLRLQKEFGTLLCGETTLLLTQLTGGNCTQVTVDRSFRLQAGKQNAFLTPDSLLSAGTADQAYLALRLAITKLLAEESGISLPLFLDDSFIQYDDSRCEKAMQLLAELSGSSSSAFSQAVLFTCHSREKRLYQTVTGQK